MKRLTGRATLVAVGIAWGLAGDALGQIPQSNDKNQRFVRQAASDGLTEVKLGKMAAEQASNPAVQGFGQRMVTNHTTANQALMALAQAKHPSIPQEPNL